MGNIAGDSSYHCTQKVFLPALTKNKQLIVSKKWWLLSQNAFVWESAGILLSVLRQGEEEEFGEKEEDLDEEESWWKI